MDNNTPNNMIKNIMFGDRVREIIKKETIYSTPWPLVNTSTTENTKKLQTDSKDIKKVGL